MDQIESSDVDGRLTDARGRQVDFRNAIIIMTSNIGSDWLLEGITPEGQIEPKARDQVMAELRVHFRPEFLNRVDDIVLFKPLTLSEIERVVDLLIEDVARRLQAQRIELVITDAARQHIAREGFDPVYGARPLRRFIQHEVESRIGRALLRGEAVEGSTCIVDVADDELDVRIETSRELTEAVEAEPRVSGMQGS